MDTKRILFLVCGGGVGGVGGGVGGVGGAREMGRDDENFVWTRSRAGFRPIIIIIRNRIVVQAREHSAALLYRALVSEFAARGAVRMQPASVMMQLFRLC